MTNRENHGADVYVFNRRPSPKEDTGRSENRIAGNTSDGVMNDHQLLSAYVRGDERAFETLVEKYFRMVYTVAARRTGDSHLAEEIAQSVFLLLSRKARGLSPKAPLPGWLMRATRFVCWDAIKMRRRRDEHERTLAMNLDPQVETAGASSTQELLLEEALQALRPEEQAGIMARFFEGKDFGEIAEMFAISEPAARKRTSRCLAKLQRFMSRRGAKVALPALAGLLAASAARAASNQGLQTALNATHAVLKGTGAVENVISLAGNAARWLRRRFYASLSLKVGLALLVGLGAVYSLRVTNPPVGVRVQRLGKAWGSLDHLVALHTQFLMQTPPNTPNYQARIQEDLTAISREASRITGKLNPLLASPDARTRLAEFLTAELVETLKLDASRKEAILSYIRRRLSQGSTFNEAMKALAENTQAEATDIMAMLTAEQRLIFDQEYGADGARLFSYAKAIALGRIGP